MSRFVVTCLFGVSIKRCSDLRPCGRGSRRCCRHVPVRRGRSTDSLEVRITKSRRYNWNLLDFRSRVLTLDRYLFGTRAAKV